MPPTRAPIVVDGLWRCLCPILERPLYAGRLQSIIKGPRIRETSTSVAKAPADDQPWHHERPTRLISYRPLPTTRRANEEDQSEAPQEGDRQAVREVPSYLEQPWQRPTRPGRNTETDEELKERYRNRYSKQELYDRLGQHAARGDTGLVKWLVNHLVEDRHELPNEELYAALIRVNVNEREGSAGNVISLLQEMREEGFSPSGGLYHDVLKVSELDHENVRQMLSQCLKVLAVHPDYLLRDEVLQEMRERWLALTPTGWHDVVAGLLREQQYEMALNKLEMMQQDDVPIQDWLCDMTIYMLINADELDEALRLMKERIAMSDRPVSSVLWYYLLDGASKAYHYPAVYYVWRKSVETQYLNPPSGMCLNVLNTAARQGDAQLATDVFRVLGNRATIFEHLHYEMLIDAYMASGDLRTALTILCVMQGAGTQPDDSNTRSIYQFVRRDVTRCDEGFNILRSLHHDGRPVPTAALNAIIEATIYTGDLRHALEQYKALHLICPSGPTTATFNALFRGCHIAQRKDLAMFLASEMSALKIKPDATTYDRLLLVCLHQDDYEDAFRYLEEMKGQGFTPRPGTWTALVHTLTGRNDPRCFELVLEMKANGMLVANTVRWLRSNWKGSREVFVDGMQKLQDTESSFEEEAKWPCG